MICTSQTKGTGGNLLGYICNDAELWVGGEELPKEGCNVVAIRAVPLVEFGRKLLSHGDVENWMGVFACRYVIDGRWFYPCSISHAMRKVYK